jgi:hypothetical protein
MASDPKKQAIERLGGPKIHPGCRVLIDGHYYRVRRGKLVQIPDEWVGKPNDLCGDRWWRKWRKFRAPRQSKSPRKNRMRDGGHGRVVNYYGRVPREKIERGKAKGIPHKGSWVDTGHPRGRAPRHVGTKERQRRRGEEGW